MSNSSPNFSLSIKNTLPPRQSPPQPPLVHSSSQFELFSYHQPSTPSCSNLLLGVLLERNDALNEFAQLVEGIYQTGGSAINIIVQQIVFSSKQDSSQQSSLRAMLSEIDGTKNRLIDIYNHRFAGAISSEENIVSFKRLSEKFQKTMAKIYQNSLDVAVITKEAQNIILKDLLQAYQAQAQISASLFTAISENLVQTYSGFTDEEETYFHNFMKMYQKKYSQLFRMMEERTTANMQLLISVIQNNNKEAVNFVQNMSEQKDTIFFAMEKEKYLLEAKYREENFDLKQKAKNLQDENQELIYKLKKTSAYLSCTQFACVSTAVIIVGTAAYKTSIGISIIIVSIAVYKISSFFASASS